MTDPPRYSNIDPFTPGGFLHLSSGGIPAATGGRLCHLQASARQCSQEISID